MFRRWFLGLSGLGLSVALLACASHREEPVDALDEALTAQDFDTTVQQLTQLPYLPWAYTTDGCYARATYYSMLLATKGVPTNHVYVVARPGTSLGGIWRWHVAPLVTKDGDPNHLYVLDPVYDQTKALTNVEWVAHQNFADPSASNYPRLHVHPGNSYLDQFEADLPLVNPGEPNAVDYKEPSFAEMPSFHMTDVSAACSTMHRYIDYEPGTSSAEKASKHQALGRETQRIVRDLSGKGKLDGEPTLSSSCTRGAVLDTNTDAGAAPDNGGVQNDENWIDPTRQGADL